MDDAAMELAGIIKNLYAAEGADVLLDALAGSFAGRLGRLMSRAMQPVNGMYEVRVQGMEETFRDRDPVVALCRAYVGAMEALQ